MDLLCIDLLHQNEDGANYMYHLPDRLGQKSTGGGIKANW